jgi:hypothetical protein
MPVAQATEPAEAILTVLARWQYVTNVPANTSTTPSLSARGLEDVVIAIVVATGPGPILTPARGRAHDRASTAAFVARSTILSTRA